MQTLWTQIANEYDQEKPQSQTSDKPVAPRGRTTQHSVRQIKQSNHLSLPHQDGRKNSEYDQETPQSQTADKRVEKERQCHITK